MRLILEKGADQQTIRVLRDKLKKRMQKRAMPKGFDAFKYNGIIATKEDPLTIQKRLRDEWERDLS